jgi:uncharacterized protein (DUF488 family)
MLTYRKKILLSFIQIFGGDLSATDLQKLLFLFEDSRVKKDYEFIPYKFGCFSLQVMYDKGSLIKDGFLISDEKRWIISAKSENILNSLDVQDRYMLSKFKQKYSNLRGDELIKYIYTNFPYFAINSEIAGNILNEQELKIVNDSRPKQNSMELFTIGYEGISLENYLNKLISNNVQILCDVRKNSYSHKYGFSKNQLQGACEKVGISFIHIPDLGINSDKRTSLETQEDYERLFDEYEKTTLKQEKKQLVYLFELVKKHKRIAITCFESSHKQCHRGRISKAMSTLPDWNIQIKHL